MHIPGAVDGHGGEAHTDLLADYAEQVGCLYVPLHRPVSMLDMLPTLGVLESLPSSVHCISYSRVKSDTALICILLVLSWHRLTCMLMTAGSVYEVFRVAEGPQREAQKASCQYIAPCIFCYASVSANRSSQTSLRTLEPISAHIFKVVAPPRYQRGRPATALSGYLMHSI